MEVIFGLLGLVLAYGVLILPWVNRHRVLVLREEVETLKAALAKSGKAVDTEVLGSKPSTMPLDVSIRKSENPYLEAQEKFIPAPEPELEPVSQSPDPVITKQKFNFEQQFGARLPVWVGGIALALSGFYLVKYSIDHNLLSPSIRVLLGGIFGMALLGAADWMRRKADIADGTRISQSLSGAGIAILYVTLFAASNLYHMISEITALVGVTVVTGVAVTLSLRHGAPIALLGLVAGFLTPALTEAQHIPTPVLFLYLYLIFTALMIVIHKRRWWWMSLPTILGTFLWVIYWIAESFVPADTGWVGLFLLGVSATIVTASHRTLADSHGKEMFSLPNLLNYLGLSGAILLMGVINVRADFGLLEWGLFGALSIGGVVLAYFKDRIYGFMPWVLMAVNGVMIALWQGAAEIELVTVFIFFCGIYAGGGYMLLWRSYKPVLWGGLVSAAVLGYYVLAYNKLGHSYMLAFPMFWGVLALVLAAGAIDTVRRVQTHFKDDRAREQLLALFSMLATVFITLALTIELEREFLSVAVAVQILALAWINTRVSIKALRFIAMALTALFAFLLFPQILLLVQLTAFSLAELRLPLQANVPLVNWPLFQLGLPAVSFIAASIYFRRKRDDYFVRSLEMASIALVLVMGYYLIRHFFHVGADVIFVKAGFLERGVITNVLFAYGCVCLYLGTRFDRVAVSWGGLAISAIGFFRIFYFDMGLQNPLWTHQELHGVVLFNTLLLPFGLPLLWAWFIRRELEPKWAARVGIAIALIVFTLINLNVRFAYHGVNLEGGYMSNEEIYTYSIIWLIVGIGLLGAGTYRQDKTLRQASLVVMILTVGKVFLFDASELEGLFRVFSFMGLGVCLLGLSYFYTRFVFKKSSDISQSRF